MWKGGRNKSPKEKKKGVKNTWHGRGDGARENEEQWKSEGRVLFSLEPQLIQRRNSFIRFVLHFSKHTHLSWCKSSTAVCPLFFFFSSSSSFMGGVLRTTSQTRRWCKTQVGNRSRWVSADMGQNGQKYPLVYSKTLISLNSLPVDLNRLWKPDPKPSGPQAGLKLHHKTVTAKTPQECSPFWSWVKHGLYIPNHILDPGAK